MNNRDFLAISAGAEMQLARLADLLCKEVPGTSLHKDDVSGKKELPYGLEVVGSFALVRIHGPIYRGLPEWMGGYGYQSQEWITEAIDHVLARPEIETVILSIHSPGGLCTGTPETAAKIREASESGRRVIAWGDFLVASAAYWLACAADRIYTIPTARVGSIGAVIAFYDYAAMLEREGIRLEAFTSDADGKLRGAMGRATTEEDRAYFKKGVDMWGGRFRGFVEQRRGDRGLAVPEIYSGDTWDAQEALGMGLIDGVAPTLADAIQMDFNTWR